jgi:hypothetical protein
MSLALGELVISSAFDMYCTMHNSARLDPKLSPPVLRRRPMGKTPSLQLLRALLRTVFAHVTCVRLPHLEIDKTAV